MAKKQKENRKTKTQAKNIEYSNEEHVKGEPQKVDGSPKPIRIETTSRSE